MAQATREHYWARRSFGFGERNLERGEVLELTQKDFATLRNTQKLVDIGYFQQCHPGHDLFTCGECGKVFLTDAYRQVHGDEKHSLECTECLRRFRSPGALEEHAKQAHREVQRRKRREMATTEIA